MILLSRHVSVNLFLELRIDLKSTLAIASRLRRRIVHSLQRGLAKRCENDSTFYFHVPTTALN